MKTPLKFALLALLLVTGCDQGDGDTSSSSSGEIEGSSTGDVEGSSSSGSSSTGEPPRIPYGECGGDITCDHEEGFSCVESANHDGDPWGEICVPHCKEDSDCPAPPPGGGDAVCIELGFSGQGGCSIRCLEGQYCPEDMTCNIGSDTCMHITHPIQ